MAGMINSVPACVTAPVEIDQEPAHALAKALTRPRPAQSTATSARHASAHDHR